LVRKLSTSFPNPRIKRVSGRWVNAGTALKDFSLGDSETCDELAEEYWTQQIVNAPKNTLSHQCEPFCMQSPQVKQKRVLYLAYSGCRILNRNMNFSHLIEHRAWGLALALHLMVGLMLVVRFTPTNESLEPVNVIQAVAISPPNATQKTMPEVKPQPTSAESPQLHDTATEEELTQPAPKPDSTPEKSIDIKPQPVAKPQPQAPVANPTPPQGTISTSPMSRDIEHYRTIIAAAIGRYWLVPPNLNPKLTTILMVRIAPGGLVLDVQVAQSSGSVELDQSAMLAVSKASPLPVPSGDLFDQFRELRLTVRPEGIISQT
jgi:TonB family protein